jgi:hypothetical protein
MSQSNANCGSIRATKCSSSLYQHFRYETDTHSYIQSLLCSQDIIDVYVRVSASYASIKFSPQKQTCCKIMILVYIMHTTLSNWVIRFCLSHIISDCVETISKRSSCSRITSKECFSWKESKRYSSFKRYQGSRRGFIL